MLHQITADHGSYMGSVGRRGSSIPYFPVIERRLLAPNPCKAANHALNLPHDQNKMPDRTYVTMVRLTPPEYLALSVFL